LDLMILEVFSNLSDSMISLSFAEVSDTCLLPGRSVAAGGQEERSHPCL